MEFLFPLFGAFFILGLAALAFHIWMLVDAVQRPAEHFNPPESRTWWIIGLAVGLALTLVGLAIALVYFFMVRKPATEGRLPRAPLSCRSCGARLAAGARFCHSCGSTVSPEGA